MRGDPRVGRVDEELLQIVDVHVDALRGVPIGPVDDDVLGVALVEPVPLLMAEDIEIEGVEDLQVLRGGELLGLVGGEGGAVAARGATGGDDPEESQRGGSGGEAGERGADAAGIHDDLRGSRSNVQAPRGLR